MPTTCCALSGHENEEIALFPGRCRRCPGLNCSAPSGRKNWRRAASAALAIAALAAGCAEKVHLPVSSPSSPSKERPLFQTAPAGKPAPPPAEYSIANAKPAFSLNVEQFYEEWLRNPKVAQKKYVGQVIELTGFVKGVGTLPTAQAVIYLQAGASPLGVICQFREEKLPSGVAPNQMIRIKGKWPELAANIGLVDCVLMR